MYLNGLKSILLVFFSMEMIFLGKFWGNLKQNMQWNKFEFTKQNYIFNFEILNMF